MENLRVETAYDYEEYADHVNLDCLAQDEELNATPFNIIANSMTDVTSDGGVKKQVCYNFNTLFTFSYETLSQKYVYRLMPLVKPLYNSFKTDWIYADVIALVTSI